MTTIRPAQEADAASIAAIVNALLLSTTIEWRYEPYSRAAMERWIGDHECVLVAEEEGEVVGIAAYADFRDVVKWPGYRFVVENTVHVRDDRRGSGVGRLLMLALLDVARMQGKHATVAAVDGANEPSIRFHERLGFTEVARMPEVGAKFGRWLDLVFLEIRLDDRLRARG